MNTTLLSMLIEANKFKDSQISSLENLIKSMSKCNDDLIEENISLKEEIEKYKNHNKKNKQGE